MRCVWRITAVDLCPYVVLASAACKSGFVGEYGGLGAVVEVEVVEDACDVGAGGVLADEEGLRYFCVYLFAVAGTIGGAHRERRPPTGGSTR
jgi:hypothetical protein